MFLRKIRWNRVQRPGTNLVFPTPSANLTCVLRAEKTSLATRTQSKPLSVGEPRRKLSLDLEFCCFSHGYTEACLTCPFPEDQRPEPDFFVGERGGDSILDFDSRSLRRACLCLGIDHMRLDARSSGKLTQAELKTSFHKIAFSSHPDTASSPDTADNKTFREAFSSYTLLRNYLKV